MARYYIVVSVINVLFAVTSYVNARKWGITSKALLGTVGLSMFIGLIFPLLAGYFGLAKVVVICLVILALGSHGITKLADGEQTPNGSEYADYSSEVASAGDGAAIAMDTADAAGIPPANTADNEGYLLTKDGLTGSDRETTNEAPAELVNYPQTTAEQSIDALDPTPAGVPDIDSEAIKEDTGLEDNIQAAVLDGIPDEEPAEDEAAVAEDETAVAEDETAVAEESETANGFETADPDELTACIETQGDTIMGIQHLHIEDETELRDSYIARGFDAKAERLDLAVKYFSSALELNPPIDLDIMLVFDIYAMLRELGQYQNAAECLTQFAKRRADKMPRSVAEKLEENLKYVEILQEMLAKANSPNLPFSKVPALIKVSVEEKINQWKNEVF